MSGLKRLTDDENVAMENIKYKNILLKFYLLLLEKLDPNEVSVQLLTAGVLTSDDKEKVDEKPSQREKSEELLMILATKGPRAYEEFVKALEKDHSYLACQLLKEEKENLLYEVREREWLLNETMDDLLLEEERAITAASENEKLKAQLKEESEEIVHDHEEVSRLLKKIKDEISVENREKEASEMSSVEAVLKELGIQFLEGEDEDEQKEVAKLRKEVYDGNSVKNRKKEGSKDVRLEAASVKEPNIQPQEASSHEGTEKPKRKGSKKKPMAS